MALQRGGRFECLLLRASKRGVDPIFAIDILITCEVLAGQEQESDKSNSALEMRYLVIRNYRLLTPAKIHDRQLRPRRFYNNPPWRPPHMSSKRM